MDLRAASCLQQFRNILDQAETRRMVQSAPGLLLTLYFVAALCAFAGRVARATGRVTRSGAFIDSVADRYAELAVFGGLLYYYRLAPWVMAVVLAAGAGSLMVSYARARGESLGVEVKIGTMQRPERLFYLGVVVAHSPLVETLVGGGESRLHPPALLALR